MQIAYIFNTRIMVTILEVSMIMNSESWTEEMEAKFAYGICVQTCQNVGRDGGFHFRPTGTIERNLSGSP
jgi:hypothetical protein